jgi:hypothetical protein
MSPGMGRINIVVPGSSATAATERDLQIGTLAAITGFSNTSKWRYIDSASGLGMWGYYAILYGYSNGALTVGTVTCTGMAHPPSGSDLIAMPDPGPGTTYTWSPIGAPFSISTSSDRGGGGGAAPNQNSGYNVWRIAGNASNAPADFTAAVAAVTTVLTGLVPAAPHYFKFIDGVSGIWQVSAIWFAPGYAWYNPSSSNVNLTAPNSNIFYVVTCSGTANPPTGSSQPPLLVPSFTQTFTALTSPLNFGPQR